MDKLAEARVIIFGLGGVGGFVAEALARTGVGSLTLVDPDTVDISNINRQIAATEQTVGRYKTEVIKERLLSVNPIMEIEERRCFVLPENIADFDFAVYDYVVDAVDTVSAKLAIICAAKTAARPLISAAGAGNKLHPELLKAADIYETKVCPLCRVLRRELRRLNVESCRVVYSEEEPCPIVGGNALNAAGKPVPGSAAFVPGTMGLIIAAEIVRNLTGK